MEEWSLTKPVEELIGINYCVLTTPWTY